jgi:kynurenine formamidase
VAPSRSLIGFPIHVLAINAMGVHLLDYLQFEDVLPQCEEAERWEFLFVGAPLRIVGGTGSPLNPIAIL